jgi:hypothetical protein
MSDIEQTITVNLGGAGDPHTIPMAIEGCPCRTHDFVLALVKFAKEFKHEADTRDKQKTSQESKEPCGCGK